MLSIIRGFQFFILFICGFGLCGIDWNYGFTVNIVESERTALAFLVDEGPVTAFSKDREEESLPPLAPPKHQPQAKLDIAAIGIAKLPSKPLFPTQTSELR